MKTSDGFQNAQLRRTKEDTKSSAGRTDFGNKFLLRGAVLAIAVTYLVSLSPGHVFVNDDFAAYIMHASNLVEGRPYTTLHYIANPQALWLAPTNGYPPVYPLLLAPAYKLWWPSLKALKGVTVMCFVVCLFILVELLRPVMSPPMIICTLLILGCNPIFWEYRDYLLSEFPYLMFSFAALLVIQSTYETLAPNEFRIGRALLLAVLLYCAYGTRTIGIVLIPALALADLWKFKRPSRFLLTTIGATAVFIAVQTLFLTSPTGYISAVHVSPRLIATNTLFYCKTLSYVWQNGFSKKLQIIFALAFTALAGAGFARKLWRERSANEFYLLGYLAVLFAWSAEIGLRGLLPILPLYFANGIQEVERLTAPLGRWGRAGSVALLLIVCGVAYGGRMREESRQAPEPNVQDPAAQELFSFLRTHTEPSEAIVFPKPRSLALFTNRSVASFAPDELPEASLQFMKNIQARVIVKTNWSPPSWEEFMKAEEDRATEVFRNSEYQVFRIRLAEDSSATAGGG